MKRMLVTLLFCLMLTGCVQTVPTATETTATSASSAAEKATPTVETALEPGAENTPATDKETSIRVEPLPATLQVEALRDCMFAASFTASDVYLNEDGALVVRMTVYDYELFDLVDVSHLTQGAILVINGEETTVKTVERTGEGWVLINGGYEQGGSMLVTEENGVYYEMEADDAKRYRALGEAVLPIDQDFVFRDSSDLDGPEQVAYAGDFLMDMESGDASFSPYDTTVTVENGFITEIERVYIP